MSLWHVLVRAASVTANVKLKVDQTVLIVEQLNYLNVVHFLIFVYLSRGLFKTVEFNTFSAPFLFAARIF